MITKGDRGIVAVLACGKAVQAVRKGTRLVWQAITSCFGAGHWRNDRVWRNEDIWRNN